MCNTEEVDAVKEVNFGAKGPPTMEQEEETTKGLVREAGEANPFSEVPSPEELPEAPRHPRTASTASTNMSQLTRKRVPTNRGSMASSLNQEGIQVSGRRESEQVLQELGMDLRQRERGSVATVEGDIYADFVFEEELGKGGFGTVYKGRSKKDNQRRAIKAISVQLTNPKVFQRELDQARKLRHPNIARLLSHYRDENHFYLVMELYEGGDLLTEVTQHPLQKQDVGYSVGLPSDMLASYAWQMCSGLAYLHYHYIVHRDIKCENYMKSTPDAESALKLIDLGIAGNLQHTKTGFLTDVVGTVSTMAPEVFSGRYNEKCDVWSLGCTLYICSICQEPWVAPCGSRYLDENEIAKKLQDPYFEVTFNERRWDFRTEDTLNMVKSMLVKDPSKRPRARDLLSQDPFVKSGRASRRCCSC